MTPGVGSTSPLSDSSPKNTAPATAAAGHLGRGHQHRDGDREIEAGALLAEVGGRQVDHDPAQRPLEARVLDRGADPLAAVLHRGAR